MGFEYAKGGTEFISILAREKNRRAMKLERRKAWRLHSESRNNRGGVFWKIKLTMVKCDFIIKLGEKEKKKLFGMEVMRATGAEVSS